MDMSQKTLGCPHNEVVKLMNPILEILPLHKRNCKNISITGMETRLD